MEVLQQCGEYQTHYLVFLLVIGGALLAGGFAFSQGLKNHAGATDRRGWLAILIFFPAALASCYLLNVRSVYADIAFDRATALQAQGVRPGSLYAYELAVMLDPRIIDYRASVARLLRYYGETIADNDRSRELMRQAEQGLQEMQKYSLLNRAAYYLGELYLSWGMRENDSGMRTALGEKARAAFKQAIAYEPHSEFVWRQSANVERFLMHNQPEADRQDQIALAIGQNQDARNNGRFYTALSQEAVNGQLKQHYARRALEYYELGITDHAKKAAANELAPGSSPMDLHLGKGNVLLVLNELEAAQRCYRDATNAPGFKDVHQWQAELLLANIYYAATNQPAALAQALLAYNQAPRTVKPRLLEFVDRCRRLSTRSGRCQGE